MYDNRNTFVLSNIFTIFNLVMIFCFCILVPVDLTDICAIFECGHFKLPSVIEVKTWTSN